MGSANRDGQLEWDTDSLFATSSRPDLVGHLEGTANPGQPGNIVLAGHNYNRGAFNWIGVFYSLGTLQPGDLIYLVDENAVRFTYQVEQVDQLPWPAPSADVALAHIKRLGPSPDEILTLVTCSGGTIAPFPARVYVTARRVLEP
jgi:LPXTG-site transpeptidase (sortase) family protein